MSADPTSGRASSPRVPVLTVLPADPEDMPIGGIASFVRGFVKFAPDDFDLSFLGVSTSRDPWTWSSVVLEGRTLSFLSVGHATARNRSRIPIALRFTATVLANRRSLRRLVPMERFVAGFHRPATDLGFAGGRGPRWRVVHLSVDDLATPQSESRWRRGAPLLQAIERRSFAHMDRIYVVNERVAKEYRSTFAEAADRIEFIPNWADPTMFRPFPHPQRQAVRAEVRRQLGLNPDVPIVLFCGRLEGQKDPVLLARAFSELGATNPETHLLIAGDGSLKPAMHAALASNAKLDAAHFLGIVSRERLAELMNASDVLAITSAFETGPTVGLEALACGLPVVTTPVGEVSALVRASGAGRATPDRAATSIAGALSSVLQHPGSLVSAAEAAARPFLADRVLAPFYEANRRLAARLSVRGLPATARPADERG